MAILQNFESASRLKINLHKSCVFGVGVTNQDVEHLAARILCSASSLPFTYLGLPVGANMKRVASWREVEAKMEKRLSVWKQKSLSIGGRLTLIKSVLNSLPLYYFSLFRAIATTLKNLEKLRLNFFWGYTNSNRKIIWASSSRLYASLEDGGLNISSLKSKNPALLCKWLWRFRVDSGALWARVIKFIYGPDGGLSAQHSLISSGPWAGILKAVLDVATHATDFQSSFQRVLRCGTSIKF